MAKDKNKSSLPSLKKESAVADEKKEETQQEAQEQAEPATPAEQVEAEAEGQHEQAHEPKPAPEDAHDEVAEAQGADEPDVVAAPAGEVVPQSEADAAARGELVDAEQPAAADAVSVTQVEITETTVTQTADGDVAVAVSHEVVTVVQTHEASAPDGDVDGYLAYFDYPDDLLHAAEEAHKAGYKMFDAYSPFPIHGMDDAIGLGRSWLPWVTFGAGATGFTLANAMQFGMLTFDWPMIIGGKPYAPWPSFVPIMFELTVLIGGVTTALTMLVAAGCFRKPRILDPEFTNDRFALWISAKDERFVASGVVEFMESLHPVEIRPVHRETT